MESANVLDEVTAEAVESPAVHAPAHDEIARLAHGLWEARGDGNGSAEEDWFNAEQALKNGTWA